MRKYISLASILIILVSVLVLSACKSIPSTAVTYDELFREDYAKNMEMEHDKTREHPIYIPNGAETVMVDGETYKVIRTIEEFKENIFGNGAIGCSDNYILANDLNVKDYYSNKYTNGSSFSGKFNGNNYKIYSTAYDGGFRGPLFYKTENALLENFIISASDGSYAFNGDSPYSKVSLVEYCYYSTVQNCINYWQPSSITQNVVGIMIYYAGGSIIKNCINYGDLYVGASGAIVTEAKMTEIRNCKNYGNITGGYRFVYGMESNYGTAGIAGLVWGNDCVVDSCDNYGKVGGTSRIGGIVGSTTSIEFPYSYLDTANYSDMVISNCNNYGDIYLVKEKGTDRLEKVSDDASVCVFGVGGIAGIATKVENCKNEGNFYGFESLGKGLYVDYAGGVVGLAKEVINCSSKYSIPVQKGRAKNVGEKYGILL